MFSAGTGPKRALSTAPATGLSEASHQPPGSRHATRLTSRKPGRCGCQASTTWPGRIRRVRHASSQSPGRSAGVMDSSATATRRTGQRFGRAPTFTSALDE